MSDAGRNQAKVRETVREVVDGHRHPDPGDVRALLSVALPDAHRLPRATGESSCREVGGTTRPPHSVAEDIRVTVRAEHDETKER
jgi:hypothetical protein